MPLEKDGHLTQLLVHCRQACQELVVAGGQQESVSTWVSIVELSIHNGPVHDAHGALKWSGGGPGVRQQLFRAEKKTNLRNQIKFKSCFSLQASQKTHIIHHHHVNYCGSLVRRGGAGQEARHVCSPFPISVWQWLI